MTLDERAGRGASIGGAVFVPLATIVVAYEVAGAADAFGEPLGTLLRWLAIAGIGASPSVAALTWRGLPERGRLPVALVVGALLAALAALVVAVSLGPVCEQDGAGPSLASLAVPFLATAAAFAGVWTVGALVAADQLRRLRPIRAGVAGGVLVLLAAFVASVVLFFGTASAGCSALFS